jgi:hypothetical protein
MLIIKFYYSLEITNRNIYYKLNEILQAHIIQKIMMNIICISNK